MSSQRLQPGDRLGHYRVLDRLGQGGMGEVFLAEDSHLRRKVALKVLSAEIEGDADRLSRFQREARLVAALNHPNVVTIYAVEEAGGQHFLAMELIEGRSLRELVRPQGLELRRLVAVARDLAAALSAAHERGILHRDLKPENVMVNQSGRAKVLDFGLAKPRGTVGMDGSATAEQLTGEGCIVGTVPYMSPEQVRGRTVDHRSDLFSFGVVLYELATGTRPFGGGSGADVLVAILERAPMPLADLRPDLPRELVAVIEGCLQKAVDDRVGDAAAVEVVLADLQRDLEVERAISSGGSRRQRLASSGARQPLVGPWSVGGRFGSMALLCLLFFINWIETSAEALIPADSVLAEFGAHLVRAVHWFEGGGVWTGADMANPVMVYGYSTAYFLLFPVLVATSVVVLARAPSPLPLRVFAVATAFDYAVSLPFFLVFPVAERWSVPASGAILVSDLWSTGLIEALRPISGLDNCFPSFHVSLTVIVVLVWAWYVRRWRWAVAALGALVVLSTVALGIHWLADVVAGGALGLVSALLGRRWVTNARLERVSASAPPLVASGGSE